ncbi:MAG: NifU family protein [Alphaproteobacteria bacterium]|nr:NifU family protein [Alphaproteobacteria bacterium]
MFIQTEATPNPATVKFIPGQPVMAQGTASFRSRDDAGVSPLARRLFGVDGVTEVFLGDDFISVTKADEREWHLMKPSILGAVMEHYTSGDPVMVEGAEGAGHAASEDDDEVVGQIKELLDTRVRPAVAQDGGDITFHKFEDGIVYLTMLGACQGCPSSTATLKMGIENMLRHYIPEVLEVRPVM